MALALLILLVCATLTLSTFINVFFHQRKVLRARERARKRKRERGLKADRTGTDGCQTLNLLPTLMKLSLPAFCFESLLLLEFWKSSRTNLSLDSPTKHSKDMCRASLFFSTKRVCRHTDWRRDELSLSHPRLLPNQIQRWNRH